MATTHPVDERSNEPSVGELLAQLADQTGRLVHDEVEHAKAELREDVKHVGVGAGLAGAAGLLSVLGLATLVTAAVAALALVLDLWLAALLVAVGLFALAGLAALVAKSQVAAAGPPVRTVESVQDDLATLTGHQP